MVGGPGVASARFTRPWVALRPLRRSFRAASSRPMHLVGSIGEAVAARMFDLRLLPASTPEPDATTADRQTLVQIKLTQGKRGVALRAEPKHLLVLRLDPDLSVEVVYNGRGVAP